MSRPDPYRLSSYDFDLPKELIAQRPLKERDECRLLVLDRKTGKTEHKMFHHLPEYFNPGDCLVLNNTKVVPVRIYGKKTSGGKVEVLFLSDNESAERRVKALMKPFLDNGEKIIFPGGMEAEVVEKNNDGEFILILSGSGLKEVLAGSGQMPLPPYIKREKLNDGKLKEEDKQDYQTIYSKHEGSIAAPTAGLHFTGRMLEKMRKAGVITSEIMLHVGWGTFKPVRDDDITKHSMLAEKFMITADNIEKIMKTKTSGRRVFAVGTTSVRTLETVFGKNVQRLEGGAESGETSIFIYPGHEFKIVDCFLTNLHTPKSTPLMMACAFAGRENIFRAYEEAVKEKYRFYSYGDAMLIV